MCETDAYYRNLAKEDEIDGRNYNSEYPEAVDQPALSSTTHTQFGGKYFRIFLSTLSASVKTTPRKPSRCDQLHPTECNFCRAF